MTNLNRHILCLVAALGLCGCAGPMTPFGSLNSVRGWSTALVEKIKAVTEPDGPRVILTPRHQNLHDAFTFSITIEDPAGIPDNYKLTILYNGMDVTEKFMNRADASFIDLSEHHLRLSFKYLRLPPNHDHAIQVIYQRGAAGEKIVADLESPSCPVYASRRSVASINEFATPTEVIDLINFHAANRKINPYYVAGIIAQESKFNPLAVSTHRAVGLTQITSVSETEILKDKDWPQYPGISEMPYPLLKFAIASRRIHAGNEWRLDPSLSIQGGVEYIAYLADYWSHPDKRDQMEQTVGLSDDSFSKILLASYNAGPKRISEALAKDGANWTKDEELKGTFKYVQRALSFCDHFTDERGAE